jgi:hypothetical protein
MIRSVLVYSDLVGGVLGIIGSLVLGYPFLTEIVDRRHWDMLRSFKQQQMLGHRSSTSLSPQDIEAYRETRDRLIDERLGEYQRYRRITLWGIFCLLVAFVFMTLASYERSLSKTSVSDEAEHNSRAVRHIRPLDEVLFDCHRLRVPVLATRRGGRARGTVNKASAARQAEVAATGVTPLDVMLKNMRTAIAMAEALEKMLEEPGLASESRIAILGEVARHRAIAQKCAADAAPYVHPKLASIQHGEDPDHPLKGVTDAHRLQVILAELLEKPKMRDQVLKQLQ